MKKIEKMEKYESAKTFYQSDEDQWTRIWMETKREPCASIPGSYGYESCVPDVRGAMPAAKNEIAIDRMYADNNQLEGLAIR